MKELAEAIKNFRKCMKEACECGVVHYATVIDAFAKFEAVFADFQKNHVIVPQKEFEELIKNRPKLDRLTLEDGSVHLLETTGEAFEKLQKMDEIFQKLEELLGKEKP